MTHTTDVLDRDLKRTLKRALPAVLVADIDRDDFLKFIYNELPERATVGQLEAHCAAQVEETRKLALGMRPEARLVAAYALVWATSVTLFY